MFVDQCLPVTSFEFWISREAEIEQLDDRTEKKTRNFVTLRAEDARSEDDTDWLPEQLGQPLERPERASKRSGRCHYDC